MRAKRWRRSRRSVRRALRGDDMPPMQPDTPESLRAVTRRFLDAWRSEHGDFTRPDNWMRGFDPAFSRRLSELNLIGLTWPVAYGGRGLGNVARLAVTEE